MKRQPDDPGVDELARAMRQQETGALFWFCVSILAIGIVLLAWFVPVSVARAQEADNCQGGAISTACCCTNNCCRSIPSTDIRAIGPDEYLIIASGQTIKRTGWSPDGTIIRCFCDMIDGKWTVHPKAYTRCLYMPMPNS